MAQYDLILTQNVSAAGVEFSEKYVNLGKGDLLSGIATTKVPTVLAAGTNGYMLVRDDNEATGLKWIAISAGHSQNSDTGTTGADFTIDSDSTTGKVKIAAVPNAGENHTMTLQNEVLTEDVTLTLPAVTGKLATEAYAQGLFASNDAMVYKGTVGTGGTIEKAALEALQTYNAGWTYRVITAGTYFSVVCEVGDLITCIVDRAGSGDVDTDWTVIQTNLDGAVVGPASCTADHIAQFSGTTGKLLKDGGVLGTMAAEAAADYVTKALFDADSILAATSDNTPAALSVGEQTLVGRITGGHPTALTAAQAMSILWQAAPANKTSAGTAGHMAKDANYIYFCTGANVWARAAIATNW
jgi:hypothetical protein